MNVTWLLGLEGAVSIDQKTGVISIESINRDEGNDQVIFSVKAYEVPEPESFIIGTITLIVEDQDDNVAEIKVVGSDDKKIDIEVDEGTIDLNLDIVASDIDLVMLTGGIINFYVNVCREKTPFTTPLLNLQPQISPLVLL